MKSENHFQKLIMLSSVLVVLLLSNTVLGIEWADLATTKDGNRLSYDKKSVKEIDANTYRLWERIIYADGNVQEKVKTTIFVREINCQNNQHRIISIIDYDANGKRLFSGFDDGMAWSPIPDKSIYEDLKKIVCSQ
ncbi:MAG: hypothetical protein JW902_08415 [Syntrophaceae bacterium]|nr:hypothetical protein [Syntrophaceae bacterium]